MDGKVSTFLESSGDDGDGDEGLPTLVVNQANASGFFRAHPAKINVHNGNRVVRVSLAFK